MRHIHILVTAVMLIASGGVARSATAWLDEMDVATARSGWGTTRANASVEGKPLTLGGRTYERGLGVHAPAQFLISLDGRAVSFSALVGLDDEVFASTEGRDRASVEFLVFADENEVFNSGVIKAGMPAQQVEIDLAGVRTLLLVVEDAGDGIGWDHADWAMAKIEYAGERPVPTVVSRPEPYILTPQPGPAPRINGPRVFGARPGNPFVYRIPATGDRPMTFEAANLPAEFSLDPQTGIITGNAPSARGDYEITLHARNSSGAGERPFKLVVGDTLALTPPMGWNDWYIHYDRISDAMMRAAADQMIETGMADYGYMYVNIDDCWSKKQGDQPYRDECGRILPNERFPDMHALTDYIHSRGLRAGIYTSPGPWNCAGYVGSYGHEQIDAQTFAEWGFDFLKYDWCSYKRIAKGQTRYDYVKPYALMGEILKNLDRDIVYNLCQYGMDDVWQWGADVDGNCWRTTGDLGFSTFIDIGLRNARHHEYAHPGRWNDPDYILIGWVGSAPGKGEGKPTNLTADQQYQYMSMWSLMAAPLIFSGDMTKLDEFTLNVLCNAEVIDVDQDPLGVQGRIVRQDSHHLVMAKPLEDGSLAVGLFNLSDYQARTVAVTWQELGIRGGRTVRDLWRQQDLGSFDAQFTAELPPGGVKLIRLRR